MSEETLREMTTAVKQCPQCGKTYDDSWKACLQDGSKLDVRGAESALTTESAKDVPSKEIKSRPFIFLVMSFVLILGLLLVVHYFKNKELIQDPKLFMYTYLVKSWDISQEIEKRHGFYTEIVFNKDIVRVGNKPMHDAAFTIWLNEAQAEVYTELNADSKISPQCLHLIAPSLMSSLQ